MTGLSLTDGQIKKNIIAANKQSAVTNASHKLPLTKTQINRTNKSKNGLDLTLSNEYEKEELQKEGGVLPLLTLIPIIASALGGFGGLSAGVASAVSAVKNASAAAAAQYELERHNREVEAQLKSGTGVISEYFGKVPVIGNYLKPVLQKLGLGIKDCNKVMKGSCVKCGEGLYLRPYGEGLYIGPEM